GRETAETDRSCGHHYLLEGWCGSAGGAARARTALGTKQCPPSSALLPFLLLALEEAEARLLLVAGARRRLRRIEQLAQLLDELPLLRRQLLRHRDRQPHRQVADAAPV